MAGARQYRQPVWLNSGVEQRKDGKAGSESFRLAQIRVSRHDTATTVVIWNRIERTTLKANAEQLQVRFSSRRSLGSLGCEFAEYDSSTEDGRGFPWQSKKRL
jgi:hypothetical protein